MQELSGDDPRQIGPYDIVKVLGSGGMGRVYLGHGSGEFVAVKVMSRMYAADPMQRIRFRREIEAARKVKGDFTAKVLDSGSSDGVLWYACEYIPGPTLDEAVRAARFSGEALANFAFSLYQALKAIHAAGIVHRDLKPKNIILGSKGVRVIDFGIAFQPGQTTLTAPGDVIGTPHYMAPEQVEGGSPQQSWDVFAYGSVLTFAATGRTPFSGSSHGKVMAAILRDPPDLSGVPADMQALVTRCLEKRARNRATLGDIYRMLPGAQKSAALSTSWMPRPVSEQVQQATRLATRLMSERVPRRHTRVDPVFGRAQVGGQPSSVLRNPYGLGRQSSPGPVRPPRKRRKPPGLLVFGCLMVVAIGIGAFLAEIETKYAEPEPAGSKMPEVTLPVATFTPVQLSGTGNPTVQKVEARDRTLIVTIKFEGSDEQRNKILTESCLKVQYAAKAFVNAHPRARRKNDPPDAIEFGGVLDFPGDVAFFAQCDRSASVSEGQKLGTNKVPFAGAISNQEFLYAVVSVKVEGGKLKVLLPIYVSTTKDEYGQMCLSANGQLHKPSVTEVRSGRIGLVELTYPVGAGTLYAECEGVTKQDYKGRSVKLP